MKHKDNNKNVSDLDKLVRNTYSRKAKEMLNKGYRTTWWYIANKALSDWKLLAGANIKDKDLLNIGCFEPIDELFFVSQVKSWTAIDINPEAIQIARGIIDKELHPSLARKIKFLVADATRLPFKNESFDVVTCFSTIEHIAGYTNRSKALEEIFRVLKKGGYLAITVPNKWNLFYYLWSKKIQKRKNSDFGYEYFYTPLSLRKALLKTGFEVKYSASEWEVIIPGSSIAKPLLIYILSPLKYFGSRFGFLVQK